MSSRKGWLQACRAYLLDVLEDLKRKRKENGMSALMSRDEKGQEAFRGARVYAGGMQSWSYHNDHG